MITDKISPAVYRVKISCGHKELTYKWVHRNQIKPDRTSVEYNKDVGPQLGCN